MAFQKLALRPGVESIATQLAAMGTWWSTTLCRFFLGFLQKLGGWMRLTSTPLIGTCRGMHGWADLLGNDYLACGTEQRLEVVIGGSVSDITPLRQTNNISPAFTTVSTETAVAVADTGNGADAGDWINIVVPVSIGGIVLQGFYQIASITDANDYVINAATPATASTGPGGAVPEFTTTAANPKVEVTLDNHGLIAGDIFNVQVATTVGGITIAVGAYNVLASPAPTTNTFYFEPGSTPSGNTSAFENGGDARIEYLLPTGYAWNTPLTGWGIGDWGAGDWGLAGPGQVIAPMRQWSIDNWGEDMLASPTNGAIYEWTPPDPVPATLVATAPANSISIFVIAQLQILVSIGSESSGTQYPLLVKWSDAGDYTDFTPSATNQAGSFQIPTGSTLVAGLAVGLGALLWTDVAMWSMVYEGLPFVFGFNQIATSCEAMSLRAPAVVANAIMWPSIRGFFRFDGSGVSFFPCPVWDFLFYNVDYSQLGAVFSAVNTPFNEISWFFPFASTSPFYSAETPYGYVKFNTQDGVWDYGVSVQLQRTAWVDHPAVAGGLPVGADTTGLLQQHESSPDADGQPLMWSATSGYFDIAQGEDFAFIDLFIPDAIATPSTAQVQVTIQATDWPGDKPRVYGPYIWTPATEFLTIAVRGRQAAITIGGTDLGSSVRIGAIRYRVSADGRN